MGAQRKPLLSIGIIFKNEIRCLERCLKSLEALRKSVPSELVMADTGSDDGSREIAEKYADKVFDFPWINDFAAARNAVLDRCSGEWCMVLDCDEWLAGGADELANFLLQRKKITENTAVITIRNFHSMELDNYSDFMVPRLFRLTDKPRYVGIIHERVRYLKTAMVNIFLPHAMLYHDGYIGLYNSSRGREKLERNLKLIRAELKEKPENLLLLLQFLDSGEEEADYIEELKKALALVEKHKAGWDALGPAIFRHALRVATANKMPEQTEWLEKATKLFPKSYVIRIDINHMLSIHACDEGNYSESAQKGEEYLRALEDFRSDRSGQAEKLFGAIKLDTPHSEQLLRITLADDYFHLGKTEYALKVMGKPNYAIMDGEQVQILLDVLRKIQCGTESDLSQQILEFWAGISKPEPSIRRMKERKDDFIKYGVDLFSLKRGADQYRAAWTLFLPLAGMCILGDAAAMMATDNPIAILELLQRTKTILELPPVAFQHAISCDVRFPLPDRAMNLEELDLLSSRLAKDKMLLFSATLKYVKTDFGDNWQTLSWARALTLAAIGTFDWDADDGNGVKLARAFTTVENNLLSRYYTADALQDGHILPPLHRYGLHLIKAFAALDARDFFGTVRALREGLESCPDMKAMTEFLLDEVKRQERQQAIETASPELKQLAEQVRAILANYPEDDPAVIEIKNSPVYQKVAYLIEE